jgi:hypothetical protein
MMRIKSPIQQVGCHSAHRGARVAPALNGLSHLWRFVDGIAGRVWRDIFPIALRSSEAFSQRSVFKLIENENR